MPSVLAATLLFPLGAVAAELAGDWSVDAESCAESRVRYTADGRHEGLVFEEGRWVTLATGRYRREGDGLVVVAGDTEERLEILRLDAGTLELRNADPERMRAAGVDSVRFVRCPPAG
jgi:hypothetical protein